MSRLRNELRVFEERPKQKASPSGYQQIVSGSRFVYQEGFFGGKWYWSDSEYLLNSSYVTPFAYDKKTPNFAQGLDLFKLLKGKTKEKTRK